ncbi:hypothetical protein DFQ26_007119 [Actinomortierella ambigua]|nr:hypothetical protein DFQ26_007119 [Actinomortierella ambigua]
MMRTLNPVALAPMLLFSVILLSSLPIPSRGQASTSNGGGGSGNGFIDFPSSVPSCATCEPAFASPACQQILDSIAERAQSESSSTTSTMTMTVSNATLIACQCHPTFLDAYPSCVDCFLQTDQLEIVFGKMTQGPTRADASRAQVPTQQGLEAYCELALSENATATSEEEQQQPTTTTKTSSDPAAAASSSESSSSLSSSASAME